MKKTLTILFVLLCIVSTYLIYSYTDKETYTQTRVQHYIKQMNIGYDISVEFNNIESNQQSILGSKSDIEYAAQVFPVPEYYQAKIVFNTNLLNELSKKQINDVIVHELLHVHFTEMREYIYRELQPDEYQKEWLHYHEERMITNITKSM